MNEEKHILSLSKGPSGCLGLCIVKVEHIIVEEVALYEREREKLVQMKVFWHALMEPR